MQLMTTKPTQAYAQCALSATVGQAGQYTLCTPCTRALLYCAEYSLAHRKTWSFEMITKYHT